MELVKPNIPKILVIDDDDPIRRLLLDIFKERYDCREVSSAEEALLVLAQESFDLVISDINMGGMSGLEEQLRFLHLLRCDEVQGYLFSKPLPAAGLEQLLLLNPGELLSRKALQA